ncbi:protein of unknown function [Candidatus Nitrosacidococcus tergens]|uniref:Uncharacterized protein n=1 Tax=Candidatus Nitrosacidococcus tergens TaxID=553981 RepID=A0A7G1Q7S6_9GAMM|nr:protein of unknown function [Candidatus Nitrosacidococcus tergens]
MLYLYKLISPLDYYFINYADPQASTSSSKKSTYQRARKQSEHLKLLRLRSFEEKRWKVGNL